MATLASLAVVVPSGRANPYSEVASALDPEDPWDVHLSLDYGFEIQRASVLRERSGLPGSNPLGPVPIAKDLVFKGARHTLVPRLEAGIFTDVSLTLALPVVLFDARRLEFDQRDTPCEFPGDSDTPTCVDRSNSTTVQDGLLSGTGFDADDAQGPGFTQGATIFRGPDRWGLDQLHAGLTWAAMNQARDDTKPTWKLGGEVRLAIGSPMRLDRVDPGRETSVGRGIHELRLWTSFAKQRGWATPYLEVWWMVPLATSRNSAFQELGYGQVRSSPQQQGGLRFGVEARAWERLADNQRVNVHLGGRMEAHFEGYAYTEMWEVFQYAGTVGSGGPLVLDSDPESEGVQNLTHPGATYVENYLRLGGTLGVNAEMGNRIRFGAAFELLYAQSHAITFADAGIDLPTCGIGNMNSECEMDENEVVNPDTQEVNPSHVPLIDLVGQRYRIDEAFDYVVRVEARVLF